MSVEPQQPHYLSTRENWQAGAAVGGAATRDSVADIARAYLDTTYPGMYEVTKEPGDLKQLYYTHDYRIHPEAYARPDTPSGEGVWWDAGSRQFMSLRGGRIIVATGGGCTPDVRIKHKASGRVYFIECKHQNDAGNAHERAAKYATPSIVRLIQEAAGVSYHPVGYVFSGAMVEKRKYILELQATFDFAVDHLFLWKKEGGEATLGAWLEKAVIPLLGADYPHA